MPDASQPRSTYDAAYVAGRYEAGEREWERFERRLPDRVSLEVHRRLLAEFIRPRDRVLDAGAGPRLELARLGARVVVGDISPGQLRLNAEKLTDVGLEQHVETRELLDITDLSRFADESFDAVVCFGGPLTYVHERVDDALRGLVRVTKAGGHLLVSVMSKLGATRIWLEDILGRVADEFGVEAVSSVVRTGDLTGELNDGHSLTMYISPEDASRAWL